MTTPSAILDIARPDAPRKDGHRNAPMEPAFIGAYDGAMHDLGELLGAALRDIRRQTTGTQDRWSDRTGMSQSYLSAAERGTSGWESVRTIGTAITAAGGDPLDLLRLAVAHADLAEEDREVLALYRAAPEHIRSAILTLLKSQGIAHTAAR
jgi:transcriptional regulator with XRE-family HTH domain